VLALPVGSVLVEALGAGTIFEVAIVDHAGRRCVCKRLRRGLSSAPAARAAMRREVEVLDRLRLAFVPTLVAHGEDGHGPFCLESAFEAVSLGTLVEAWRRRRQPVPARLVDSLLAAGFEALARLHAARSEGAPLVLVHGDLGPDHLLLGRDGQLRLVDFGLARWRGMPDGLCGDGERGTLPYVAPEVARAERAPDQPNDVFALAATVAFVALGRAPCRAEAEAARLAEVGERGLDLAAIEQAANLSPTTRRALLGALSFERRDRPARASAVLAELGRCVGGSAR
jgi:serine/threonine-protein kinase